LEDVIYAIDTLGARSVDDVKRYTQAGCGLCQGKTCGRIIANILSKRLNTNLPLPIKPRPPVRPIKLSAFVPNNEISGSKLADTDSEDTQ
jgi:hypothetical protein